MMRARTNPSAHIEMPMKLSVKADDGSVLLVQCEGVITVTQVQQGLQPLEELLGPAGFSRRVLFDLAKTNFIDSSGVSWMLVCHKEFVHAGGRIVFHSAPPLVRQTLDLLRMNLVLYLAADENAAKAAASEERGR
jgi:anti-anti-sigma regulatory factor